LAVLTYPPSSSNTNSHRSIAGSDLRTADRVAALSTHYNCQNCQFWIGTYIKKSGGRCVNRAKSGGKPAFLTSRFFLTLRFFDLRDRSRVESLRGGDHHTTVISSGSGRRACPRS